jgi:hypothetical protein
MQILFNGIVKNIGILKMCFSDLKVPFVVVVMVVGHLKMQVNKLLNPA